MILSPEQPIEITGVEVPCLQCGSPIVVTVPRWLVSTGAPQGKRAKALPSRLDLWPEFGDPKFCLHCRLAALPTSALDIEGEYRAILHAAADAGIPDGAIIWPLSFAAVDEVPKRWRGWQARMLGIQVRELPTRLRDAVGINGWRFSLPDGPPVDLIIYETVLSRLDIPAASLRFHSPPGAWPARLELRGWDRVGRVGLQELMQGADLYREAIDNRGPPRGGQFESRAELARALYPVITHLREQGIRPTQERVAEHLDVESRTLQRWIGARFDAKWVELLTWSEADWSRTMES